MSYRGQPGPADLLAAAQRQLDVLLPDTIRLDLDASQSPAGHSIGDTRGADAVWVITATSEPDHPHRLVVHAKQRFSLLDLEAAVVLQAKSTRLDGGPEAGILIVAPWLSRRSRELLDRRGFNYLDRTGNVLLRLTRPAVFIRTDGGSRDPDPRLGGRVGLSGRRAGRLVRLLADVAPPYRAGELATAAELSVPYVSRLLDAVQSRGLITRVDGVIQQVDWVELLRARATEFPLLKTNEHLSTLAPRGAPDVLARLTELPDVSRLTVVTGSYAAAAVAPVTAGGQLMLYTPSPPELAEELGLLPTARDADVVLLRPADPSAITRPRSLGNVNHVALTQLAIDCLSGSGRMPAEGEAVLDEMIKTEHEWRRPRLGEIDNPVFDGERGRRSS